MAATQSKPRKAVKKAPPRKASTSRAKAKPETNGVEPEPAPEGQKAESYPITPPPEPPKKLQHPYGDGTPIYVFEPSDGSAPIIFPRITTLSVTAKFMWQIYNLNEMFQSFEWMNLAKVPRHIQERVVDLPLADRAKFWSGWFQDITAPASEQMGPPGE